MLEWTATAVVLGLVIGSFSLSTFEIAVVDPETRKILDFLLPYVVTFFGFFFLLILIEYRTLKRCFKC